MIHLLWQLAQSAYLFSSTAVQQIDIHSEHRVPPQTPGFTQPWQWAEIRRPLFPRSKATVVTQGILGRLTAVNLKAIAIDKHDLIYLSDQVNRNETPLDATRRWVTRARILCVDLRGRLVRTFGEKELGRIR